LTPPPPRRHAVITIDVLPPIFRHAAAAAFASFDDAFCRHFAITLPCRHYCHYDVSLPPLLIQDFTLYSRQPPLSAYRHCWLSFADAAFHYFHHTPPRQFSSPLISL
jgi:hypothetical protein